jgi:uncharacterized membrane protein YeaQ/YmgE (transglycosylase-associated protein family)
LLKLRLLFTFGSVSFLIIKTLNVMETILPYLLNTILGAAGGWLGNMLKKNGLGMIGNLLSGAVGGNILPILLSALGLIGHPADAAVSTSNAIDIPALITALIGGGAGSLIGGLFKKPAV